MKLRTSLCIATISIAFTTLASADQLTPLSQTRTVDAQVFAEDADGTLHEDSDSAAATDFSPFSFSHTGTANSDQGFANGGATQTSTIGSTSIEAFGSIFGQAFGSDSSAGGTSVCVVVFNVPVDSSYTLYARIHGTDGGFSSFEFKRGNTTLQFLFGPFSGATETLSVSGVLLAGNYTLYGDAFGGGGDGGGSGSFGHAEFEIDFQLEPLVTSYCTAAVNGTGVPAFMDASGSASIAQNSFTLHASGIPATSPGIFYFGSAQIQTPFGNGFRCVGGNIHRLWPPLITSLSGELDLGLDFTTSPASVITPNSTWNFQCWYRDPLPASGAGFNLTHAISATFCP